MKKLRASITRLLEELNVPGAIVSIESKRYGNLEILYGYANLEKKIPMDSSLPFRIGSITKTFTGTMVLQLYDEDKLELDAPINKALLGIPNGKEITIRQVGLMRSGLFSYTELPEFRETLEKDPYRIWVEDEMLLLGITAPVYFPPGRDFHYSNTNTVVLGLMVERLGDGSYEDQLKSRIFDPLGLKDTYYSAFAEESIINGYVPNEDGTFENVTKYNDSWAWSAGEIISTVSDMHTYLRKSIANHETISNDAARQQRLWLTSEELNGVTRSYGFQLIKLNNYIGHNGSLPGYNTFILCSPKTKTSIVILCNIQSNLEDKSPADEVAYHIVKQLR